MQSPPVLLDEQRFGLDDTLEISDGWHLRLDLDSVTMRSSILRRRTNTS